jgi:hypothetical protein
VESSADDDTENWDNKGKFPYGIKPVPLLIVVALNAIKLDKYNNDFFDLMPILFPYNRFTLEVSLFWFLFTRGCWFLNMMVTRKSSNT